MTRSSPTPAESAYTLHFADLNRSVPTTPQDSIFQAARRHGVRIVGACGGRGTCGSCIVRVTQGQVSVEASHRLDPSETPAGDHHRPSSQKWLRACQARVHSDCTVDIAPRSLAPVVRAEADTDTTETLALDTPIHTHRLQLPPASLEDPRADFERLCAALPQAADTAMPPPTVDVQAAATLPGLLRQHGWQVSAHWRGSHAIGFAAPRAPALGLAVDLGTTNAAGFLVDLGSGHRLASLGLENPQVAWGGDVISRVNHAIREPQGAHELRQAAVRAVRALAHDLTHSVGASAHDIVDLALCGNTAMHHLLLGLPVQSLGRAPFVAALNGPLDVPARDLGLDVAPGAWVHVTPGVGGFVGGDHVAALLATEALWAGPETVLLMDIGTNTEISLQHQGRRFSASSPSGPALEGGHISCGMRAAVGAIERVWVDTTTAPPRLAVQTIGQAEAVGVCGSGVLDALAAMAHAGVVDGRGRIQAQHPDVVEHAGQRAVRLAPGIHFTQDDVRAVQLAKSAIRSVTELLCRVANVAPQQIDRFVIAGAFGAYLSVDSAVAIGLLPPLPRQRFEQVGNAAGRGIRHMLASHSARARAQALAAGCQYQELASRTDFQKTFLQFIGFPKDPT